MNQTETNAVLGKRVERFKKWSYAELVQLVDHHDSFTITTPAGTRCHFELQVQWDDRPGGSLRVTGSVHDDNLQEFDLLVDAFAARPETGTQ